MLYQFLYVYELDFETGGRAYPKAIRHVYVGLFTSELTLIGLFAIRRDAKGQLVLMVITFIVTIFVLAYYERAYQPLFKYLPVSLLDNDDPALTRTMSAEEENNVIHIKVNENGKQTIGGDSLISKDTNLTESDNNNNATGSDGGTDQEQSDGILSDEESIIEGERRKMERRPTYSSLHSKTPIEAYHARQILLDRLESARASSNNKLNVDDPMVVSTLKSLYSAQAYMHPSTYSDAPTVWLPEDDLNITQGKIKEARSMHVGATSMGASVLCEKKGKGVVTIDENRLIKENYGIPGTVPEIRQNIQAYVNSLADTLNYR
jgi:hypothetical protein